MDRELSLLFEVAVLPGPERRKGPHRLRRHYALYARITQFVCAVPVRPSRPYTFCTHYRIPYIEGRTVICAPARPKPQNTHGQCHLSRRLRRGRENALEGAEGAPTLLQWHSVIRDFPRHEPHRCFAPPSARAPP